MSKLMTDSENLMDLLFDGIDVDDTPISCTIAELKKCAFDCMELRITGYSMTQEQKDKLDTFNQVFVETWRMLSAIENDFKDLIEEHFVQWKKQNGEGGEE